jgi:RNA polymerase sigma-70 factor (ECF subfamily)
MQRISSLMTDWDGIIDEHGPLVWRTVFRIVGHHGDAEDCFQATFLAAWKLDGRETIKNWPGALHRLATSRALECLRARIRGRRLSGQLFADVHPASSGNPADEVAEAELAARLMAGIAELPPLQGDIVCLVCINGLSNLEVADLIDLTPNRVGVELHRARQRLKQYLSELSDAPHDRKLS